MQIYGLYANTETEECIFVGNIHEISKFLERTEISIYSGITHNKEIKQKKTRKYNIISLYNEKKGENKL